MQAPEPEPVPVQPPGPASAAFGGFGPESEAGFTLPPLPVLPTISSADGRVTLGNEALTVRGETFLLRELDRAELTPVKWILWLLLGGLGLAFVTIAFLNNRLRTGPAMLGMTATALLLLYGRRGTNRLRLHRLGRQQVNFALPGDAQPWLQLTGELNRRIRRLHDHAAAEAAALLAAADEARRQAALAAQAREAPDLPPQP